MDPAFCNLLATVPLRDVAPAFSHLITTTSDETIESVFLTLLKHRITSIPVFDNNLVRENVFGAIELPYKPSSRNCFSVLQHRFVAFIDMMDILSYIIEVLQLEDTAVWKHGEDWLAKEQFKMPCSTLIGRGGTFCSWYTLSMDSPIQVAINVMSEQKLHRVGLVDASGHLTSVLTQSSLVRWLAAHAMNDQMGAIATQPLSSWNLGVRQVVTVPNTEQTVSALVELHRNKITGIGIINPETKCLVGNVSITDLKDMETGNNLRKMFIPLETFLQNKVEGQGIPRVVFATPKDSLKVLFEKFHRFGVHRVYLADGGEMSEQAVRPLGVIALTDVLAIFRRALVLPS